MRALRLMVEIVTDIVMEASGLATAKGTHSGDEGDHELEPETAWHFGFYSRPKDGARGVVLKADGQGNTAFLFCYRDKQYELSLEKGECGMQNAFSARVLLDKDGNVKADHGGSGKVLLGGGAQFVALANKVNDNFTAFWTLINAFFGAGFTPVPEPGNGANSALQAAIAANVVSMVAGGQFPPGTVDAANVKAT